MIESLKVVSSCVPVARYLDNSNQYGMWLANAKKCLTNSYMASRNQTAKHYGSMSWDRKSYLPRQRTLILVLCNAKAIKIGSLEHSLVEELLTHHHHRSATCLIAENWFTTQSVCCSSPYKSVSKKRSMKSTWCLVWDLRLKCLKIYR